ncbi:MAG: ABC transporter ATP-binding protein [Deltaproteobacteria bacterium]|nr:ABC transporter ATP-binding protein [Deltaproteobacteria bacterium]
MRPLEIDGLTKSFGGLQTLCGVSLTVEEGERRVILGPNGAGKTTLFHTISGVHAATGGAIRIFGTDATRLPAHRRVRLGLGRTFQITNLFPDLTVFETLFLGVQSHERGRFSMFRPAGACRSVVDRVRELVREWELGGVQDERVKNLSYGQQRQLEVILAMAGRPRLLLLDEPTAGLSPAETASMTRFLNGLDRKVTILLIEHDMDVAFEVADRITVLYFGNVLTEGTPAEVRGDPRVTEIYLGTPQWEVG